MFNDLAEQLNASPEQAENFYVMVKNTVGEDIAVERVAAEVTALNQDGHLVTVGRVAERLGAVLVPVPSREERERARAGRKKPAGRAGAKRSSRATTGKKATGSRRTKKQITMERIAEVLQANRKQAVAAGLEASEWSAEDFVKEVRRGVSRKVGKEANILKVMEDLHRQNLVLAPHLVADQVRQEFDPTL
ncbi:MAG: hypothetical protein ACE5H9_14010 [Anaerolineae bacterium]